MTSPPNAQQNASCEARIRIALVDRAQSRKVTPWEGTFDDLERNLRADGQRIAGKDGRGFIVSSFKRGEGLSPGTRGMVGWFRQKHLVDETWLLGLDFDMHPGDPLTVLEPLRALGLDVIVYTSHSHGRREYLRAKAREQLTTGKNPLAGDELEAAVDRAGDVPRYRAVLPFSRPVTPAELREIHPHICRYLGAVVDHAGADPNRLFYTPRMKAPDAELDPWIVRWHGEALDPDNLPGGVSVAELLAIATAAKAPTKPPVSEPERQRRATAVGGLSGRSRWKADERAERILQRAVDELAGATPSTRHHTVYVVGCRIGNWSAVIGASGVAHWRARAFDAAMSAGVGADRANEVDRTLDDGIARGEANPVDVDDAVGRARSILPILVDDIGDDAPAAAEPPMALDDARMRVREILGEALHTRGVVAVAADPGVGKTTVVVEALPELFAGGKRVRIALPTNKLANEIHATTTQHALEVLGSGEAVAMLAGMGLEPKRHAGNCENWTAIQAARRANGIAGVRDVCRRCNLHPTNIATTKKPKRSPDGGVVVDRNGKPVLVEKREGSPCDFFREVWAAREHSITFTTHALEVERTRARAETWIDVGAFTQADDGQRYRPAARWTPDGLRLTLTEHDDGVAPPVLDGVDDEGACRAWIAACVGADADDLEALRGKLAADADDADDLLVVDESPKAVDAHRSVRVKDLAAWRGLGDVVIDDATFTRLVGLMTAARMEKRWTPSSTLATVLRHREAIAVRRDVDGKAVSLLGAQLIGEHGAQAAQGAIPLALTDAPEAEALDALEAACRRGWSGCYVDAEGTLRLTEIRSIGGAGARSTVYLDGTATKQTARALFGPDVGFHRVAVKLHENTTTTRIDWSAAKRELPSVDEIEKEKDDKKRDELERDRDAVLTRLRAVVKRFETPTTAWVLHKAWCDDDGVRALLPDAIDDKRVIYFNSADAVGSNRFRDCTRIVLCDWFVPRAAKQNAAEVLAHRAGDDPALRGAAWGDEAEQQLEAAIWLQAAHRVRPCESPREIVAMTERGLPAFWPAPAVIDCDELVADELGILPSGKKGAAMLLAREVRAHGAVALGSRVRTANQSAENYYCGSVRSLETALQCYRGHGGLGAACADAGVSLAWAKTDSPGAGIPVVFDPNRPPDLDRVVALLTELGVSPAWVQWRDERVDLETGADEALAALVSLPSLEAVAWEAVASSLGVSLSTARRRLRSAGLTSLEGLRDAWVRAHTPDHVVVDDGDGVRVALVGTWAWLRVAPLPDVVAWERLHPSSMPPSSPSPCSTSWCGRVFR
jgi:RecA/RadA recombinase